MQLEGTKEQLTQGLQELLQQLNNVKADLDGLNEQRLGLELRVAAQRGALQLCEKLQEEALQPEEEIVDDG